eukprot:gb/GECG01003169.1/.p1 GENE.gb/GECG01003169.1/~~gb/GECG01003169.1/.p1  ORF type:complete len:344 (+),score=7.45 gb/GECG01003169.1/:1-1032(+)
MRSFNAPGSLRDRLTMLSCVNRMLPLTLALVVVLLLLMEYHPVTRALDRWRYASLTRSNLIGRNTTRQSGSTLDGFVGGVHLISTVSVRHDRELFKPFLQYYRMVMGVRPGNFHVYLHVDPTDTLVSEDLQELIRYAHSLFIRPMVFNGTFTSKTKLENYLSLLESLDRSLEKPQWVMHADADEFHSFSKIAHLGCEKLNLREVTHVLTRQNFTHVRSEWQDRIARNCSLVPFTGNTLNDVFSEYPCQTDIARSHIKRRFHTKIVLHDLRYRPKSGGYHDIVASSPLHGYPTIVTTYHFKWRATVVRKLRERVQVYRRHGLTWWRQSREALNKLGSNLTCSCL